MCLQQFRAGRGISVELLDLPVALRVVVVRIDHDLPRERSDRHRLVTLQRNGDDDEVGCGRDLGRRRRAGVRSELRDELGQGLRSARVADDDVVPALDCQAGYLAADVPRANEANSCHDTQYTPVRDIEGPSCDNAPRS